MKGTVPFVAEGQGYTLLLDFNALCELSGELPDLMNGGVELKDPRHIRLVFHAALMAKHPDLTVMDAGRIIQEVGIVEAAELLGKAFNASFGGEAGEAGENPPKRSRGTRS